MRAGEDPDPARGTRTTLAELGERELIALLRQRLPAPSPDVLVGIGDDATAIRWDQGTLLLTTDTLPEGIHFRRSTAPTGTLGASAAGLALLEQAPLALPPAVVTPSCVRIRSQPPVSPRAGSYGPPAGRRP